MASLADLSEIIGENKELSKFLTCWAGWRDAGLLPLRSSVKPEDLGATLSAMTIYQVLSEDQIVVRLYSTNLRTANNIDHTGDNFIDLLAEEERPVRIERFRNMVNYPCGWYATNQATTSTGSRIDFAVVTLPVGDAPGQPPSFFYNVVSIANGRRWNDEEAVIGIRVPENYHYIDIGNGIPE